MFDGEQNVSRFIQFNYHLIYVATVIATAERPDNTNDAAVVPSAVSLIVPLLSEMFDPPKVKTSVLPNEALVFTKRFLFLVEPVAV